MIRLDWTQPLELNGRSLRGTVGEVEVTETRVTATIALASGGNEQYYFNPLTGVLQGHENRDDACRIRNKSKEVAHRRFRIWFGRQDWAKDDWRYAGNDRLYQFDDPKLAAEAAKALNAEANATDSAWRFMVKSHTEMSPDHKWRSWMKMRFESGEYAAVPWAEEPWVIKDHFAHPAMADPFKIAFVASPEDGVMDKITVMSPGSYLKQYYDDKLSPSEIAMWAVRLDSEAELKFAVTPEDIVRVYTTSGIDSCMRHSADKFQSGGIHPTAVYGAGDLELAYLERRGKICARALVRRSNMAVHRIYGDQERFLPRLQEQGFTYNNGDNTPFRGAKLQKIVVHGSEVVMPYLDWSMRAKDNPDDPNTLLLCDHVDPLYRYSGGSTNGLASGRSIHTCGHSECSETFGDGVEGALYYHDAGRNFCPSCSTQHLRTCYECGRNRLVGSARECLPLMTGTGRQSTSAGRARMVCRSCISGGYYVAVGDSAYLPRDTVRDDTGNVVPRHTLTATTA